MDCGILLDDVVVVAVAVAGTVAGCAGRFA